MKIVVVILSMIAVYAVMLILKACGVIPLPWAIIDLPWLVPLLLLVIVWIIVDVGYPVWMACRWVIYGPNPDNKKPPQ
jgi:hypothetical protein